MRVWLWPLALLLCGSWLDVSLCFPNGSVSMACGNMLPVHEPFSPSSSSPPYTLSASADTYRPGERITVTLEVKLNSTGYFEGFFLQARSTSQPELWPVGKFKDLNNSLFTALTCNDKVNSAVSQANTAKRTKVQLTWEAPDDKRHGDVCFRATVVQSYSLYWLDVTSGSVQLERSPGAPTAVVSWTLLLLTLPVHS